MCALAAEVLCYWDSTTGISMVIFTFTWCRCAGHPGVLGSYRPYVCIPTGHLMALSTASGSVSDFLTGATMNILSLNPWVFAVCLLLLLCVWRLLLPAAGWLAERQGRWPCDSNPLGVCGGR